MVYNACNSTTQFVFLSVGLSLTFHIYIYVNVGLCGKLNVVQESCQIWLGLCHSSSFKPSETAECSQQLDVIKGTCLGLNIFSFEIFVLICEILNMFDDKGDLGKILGLKLNIIIASLAEYYPDLWNDVLQFNRANLSLRSVFSFLVMVCKYQCF